MEQSVTVEQSSIEELAFLDKLAGMFYEPSRVFESFKSAPVRAADWIVPVILVAILASISAYIRISSPVLRFQAAQQIEQRLDKMVTQGKITADQAERAKETLEKTSPSTILFGVVSAFAGAVIVFFLAAAIWLFVGKVVLKGNVNYSQMMGVAGFSAWILVVGIVLAILLSVLLSRPDGGLNFGLLLQLNPASKTYLLMNRADLFTIWNLAVTSMGIGTLSGKRGVGTFTLVFGIWIVVTMGMVFIFGRMVGG